MLVGKPPYMTSEESWTSQPMSPERMKIEQLLLVM